MSEKRNILSSSYDDGSFAFAINLKKNIKSCFMVFF